VPITLLILGSVEESELASAAGQMNFLRTLAGAIGTSLINTAWEDGIKYQRADLVAISDPAGVVISKLQEALGSLDAAREGFAYLLESQACMLATNALMFSVGIIMAVGAISICLAPKPARQVDASHVH
jgi:DHA2 family multidrug resistance protein